MDPRHHEQEGGEAPEVLKEEREREEEEEGANDMPRSDLGEEEEEAKSRRASRRMKKKKKKRRPSDANRAAKPEDADKQKRALRPLQRERSGLFPADEGEGADVLMLNKDDILSDRLERKMRNLNQLRRSSVVSGMKELWMEDLPHPQRSLSAWDSRDMPSGYGEASRDELEKELYQCLSAKTALILPFHWGDNQKSITQWIDRLLKRTIIDKDSGRRVKLWESDFMLPFEVSELSAHFRQIVGWNETVKRFLHEQQQQQQQQKSDDKQRRDATLADMALHQHSEFAPRPDEIGQSHAEKEERRKDRMHRRMNKQMTQKRAGGAGSRRQRATESEDGSDRRGRRQGEADEQPEHERWATTTEGETEEDEAGESRDDGPNRNCLLMDEGGDVEAEQEEEEVDSIANDLEVWKCQRMKLTRKAREILFPNPCIWASSGDAVPSPVQARDEERRRHMAGGSQATSADEGSETESESDGRSLSEGESGIPRIPPPPAGTGRPHVVQHSVSEPNLPVPPTMATVEAAAAHELSTPQSRERDRKVSVPSLPTSWEDYALTGSAPAGTVIAPPELPQGSTGLSSCDKKIGFEVEMDSVELVMYPLGCGLLVFHLNWMPEKLKDVPLTLDELRTWLFLVKFRHKVKKVFLGWTLGMEAALIAHGLSEGIEKKKASMGPFLPAHLRSLGRLGNSIYGDELLSLCTIGNWLLQLPHEDPNAPIRRISYGACANHHTTVVLDREPDEADLKEYLFHLTRAFGQRNRPPPPGVAEQQRLDHVLVHRLNRYIGVSREGTVAMSWPTDTANQHFEAHTWPKLFQGVYLILCLHARGEASVLSELSNLSASAAEHLRLESLMEGETLEKLEKDRTYLRYLAVLLIKYSLGMSSDDCGGLSEYSHFFSTMRRVLRIPETRQEIREEIHDVLGIVEGGYLEEQRRQLQEEKRAQKKKERERYKSDRDKDAQKRRIEILLSIIGAITLPLVLVSGIWGMNVHDLPDLSFWPLLGVTSGSSLIFLAILLGWLFFLSPRPSSSRRGGGQGGGGGGNGAGGYTSLASTATSSPRTSLDIDRTMSSLETGTTSERSLASAFAALSGISKRDSRQDLQHHDYLTPSRSRMSVNTTTPRVSFNLPRNGNGNGNGNGSSGARTHDLYSNPW